MEKYQYPAVFKEFFDGKSEGRVEEKKFIAKNMLQEGLKVALICKVTGLSESEVTIFIKPKVQKYNQKQEQSQLINHDSKNPRSAKHPSH